jgi:Fe-S-cluster-containing dehydrogenase component/formate-dependent nitrite reductase membrane component NrfD
MNYGFAIDHRKCIGCHACTVACKSENEVPLGVFRTWVKYIERGEYPDTRRYFSVLRCNHCEDAPCITICPVTALYKRDDGIVDFDGRRCIGCKACMQACPYDALYINPNTNTAEKCNFCAHRIEAQLEPACVIVCPVQAIVSGDLHDPASQISRLIASEETLVRKPEAGTRPKVYYVDVDPAALVPSQQSHAEGYLWAEQLSDPVFQDTQALAAAEARARVSYDVAHDRPWGWKVSAYLWTKSIAAGAFFLAAIAIGLGIVHAQHWLFAIAAPRVSMLFLLATVILLVADLKRPDRFLYLLLRPQWKSWLVIGGYILVVYGGILGAFVVAQMLGFGGLAEALVWPGAVAAALTATYSAYLFKQARGRVFWNSPLLSIHLFVQMIVAGGAVLMIVAVLRSWMYGTRMMESGFVYLQYELIGALVAHTVLMAAELFMPEESIERSRAVRLILRGPFLKLFWGLAVVAGTIVPLIALVAGLAGVGAVATAAALLSLGGILAWEHVWVQAGQAVPLS